MSESEFPAPDDEMEQLVRLRRRRAVRGMIGIVLLAAVATFVAQNSRSVAVHFLFFTGHPRLIWVVLVSLVVGIVFGYLEGSPGRRKSRKRRRAERQQQREGRRAEQ